MSYLYFRQEPALGDFGCGPGCRCAPCRVKQGNPFVGEPGSLAKPAGPVFRIQCPTPPGCPPIAAGQCRNVLRQAIREAIKLANNAANKLEAASKLEPSKRDAETKETARLFKGFFGHDPSRPVPWASNQESAVSVARRFRAVANALQMGGRNTLFRCDPGCDPTTTAWANAAVEPNMVNLCALFWNPPAGLRGLPPPFYRAGAIIHEMLHLLYHEFFHHAGHPSGDPERRRDNANCYEAFALRVAGFGADPAAVRQCWDRPA